MKKTRRITLSIADADLWAEYLKAKALGMEINLSAVFLEGLRAALKEYREFKEWQLGRRKTHGKDKV